MQQDKIDKNINVLDRHKQSIKNDKTEILN